MSMYLLLLACHNNTIKKHFVSDQFFMQILIQTGSLVSNQNQRKFQLNLTNDQILLLFTILLLFRTTPDGNNCFTLLHSFNTVLVMNKEVEQFQSKRAESIRRTSVTIFGKNKAQQKQLAWNSGSGQFSKANHRHSMFNYLSIKFIRKK